MRLRASLLLAALLGLSAPVLAADPAPFTGNIMLASDYKFRGFTQTLYKPALQGGFDFTSKSGFYLGNWNSNVEQTLYNGASLEMDLYGGYKGTAGAISYDLGAIYYAYPGSVGPRIDNKEIYVGLGMGPVTAKLYYSVGDYFSTQAIRKASATSTPNGSTEGTTYLDLAYTYDLGDGWGLAAHVGFLNLKNGKVNGLPADSVTDYKLGVTKDIKGWVVAASYITTSKKDFFLTGATGSGNSWVGGKSAGDAKLLVSLAKTF